MKPGRELDALIAEKVMGRQVPIKEQCSHGPNCLQHGTYSYYSTDIAAAWTILLRFQSYSVMRNDLGWHSCGIWSNDIEYQRAEGETPAHAICLAALKTVGVAV